MPATEAFVFMLMDLEAESREAEREQQKFWLQYLIQIFSQRSEGKENPEFAYARRQFENTIKPKGMIEQPKKYEWNIPEDELNKHRLKKLEKGGKP